MGRRLTVFISKVFWYGGQYLGFGGCFMLNMKIFQLSKISDDSTWSRKFIFEIYVSNLFFRKYAWIISGFYMDNTDRNRYKRQTKWCMWKFPSSSISSWQLFVGFIDMTQNQIFLKSKQMTHSVSITLDHGDNCMCVCEFSPWSLDKGSLGVKPQKAIHLSIYQL